MSDYRLAKVRPSTAAVLQQAEHVRIDGERLAAFARQIPADEVQAASFNEPFHYVGEPARTLAYVMTLDTVNFGSGWADLWPHKVAGSGYKTMASGMKRLVEQAERVDADFLLGLDEAYLAATLRVREDFPLVPLFMDSLRQMGRLLAEDYGGRYENLLAEVDDSAADLVQILSTRLPTFDDVALYAGQPVYLLKKAQILVSDLYLAFEGLGWGKFSDIAELTTFADNLVPHVLQHNGALVYTPDLLEQITEGVELPTGSAAEVEIRSAAVQAVEMLKALVNARGYDFLSIQLDWYLWTLGQTPAYKAYPRHRTRTIFY